MPPLRRRRAAHALVAPRPIASVVLLGITVVFSVTIIVANPLVDLAYFVLDPRTRDAPS